jgi:nickel-type superoxide dismutase maturation protease
LSVAAAALVAWGVDRVEVVGSSMAPTFGAGDRLVLVRRWRPLRAGDLVAFADPTCPERWLVKRVRTVHGGTATVRGDNEAASTDSRSFGAVPVGSIRHLVVRRYARGDGT